MNNLKTFIKNLNWPFLLFLIGATNVKLYVKIASVIVYAAYFLFKKYELPLKLLRINVFYIIMPIVGLAGALAHVSFGMHGYWLAYALGSVQWLTAGGILYLTYATLKRATYKEVTNVIKMFFALNAIISCGELVGLMISSKHFMPYWFWEPTEYYLTSTGDHIKGLFGSQSLANAMVNVIGALYFLYYKRIKWAFLCTAIMCLCTSNVSIMLFLGMLLLMVLSINNRKVRLGALFLLVFTIGGYIFLSPVNIEYIATVYKKNIKTTAPDKKDLVINKGNRTISDTALMVDREGDVMKYSKRTYFRQELNSSFHDYVSEVKALQNDTTATVAGPGVSLLKPQHVGNFMGHIYELKPEESPLSSYMGMKKIYTFKQTLYFLEHGPLNLLFGAGMGNFSSKLALKTAGLGLQGSYSEKNMYISDNFLRYHFYTLTYILSRSVSEHSVINMPNSIYNQIAGEYGVAGLLAFVILYLGYFWKNKKKLGAGKYILLMMLAFFLFEYWFEMMSLTVIFELLILQETVMPDQNKQNKKNDGDRINAGI